MILDAAAKRLHLAPERAERIKALLGLGAAPTGSQLVSSPSQRPQLSEMDAALAASAGSIRTSARSSKARSSAPGVEITDLIPVDLPFALE